VLLPLSFGVAVLTATALLLLAASVRTAPPTRADGGAEHDNELAVRRFYQAVNRVLRGGDAEMLSRAFAPEALTPATSVGKTSPVDLLVDRLTAVRHRYPDVQFTVEALAANGDVVIAQIAVGATQRRSAGGLAIDGPPFAWHGDDRFRFVDGLIVEYVARWETLAAPEAGWSATVDHPPGGPTLVAVVRFTLLAGMRLPPVRAPLATTIYVVQSGRLLTESSGTPLASASAPATPSAAGGPWDAVEQLRAGDRLVVPAGVSVGLDNEDATAAVVLAVVLAPFSPVPRDEASASQTVTDRVLAEYEPDAGAAPEIAWPSGLTVQGLTATVVDGFGPLPLVVAGDPALLAPGETIGKHRVDGLEFVLVEAGLASLIVTSPELHVSRAPDNARPASPGVVDESGPADGKSVALANSDAAAIVGGTVQAVSNAGEDPLSLLVLTITPVDDQR
jgi:hypothetical protein